MNGYAVDTNTKIAHRPRPVSYSLDVAACGAKVNGTRGYLYDEYALCKKCYPLDENRTEQ